ncbi:small ribosomal subunit protein mS47-like [Wolffia australiana]
MMNSKALCQARRSRSISRLLPRLWSSTASSEPVVEDAVRHQVLVEGRASSRNAVLNRPASLNAITTSMAARLMKLYNSWEENPDIGFVVLRGSGRAFCAGGDVVTLYRLLNQGRMEDCKEFFRTLYEFIYILGTFLKPHVAILNGITMGGGGGISIPGTFRIATDKTIFATPETSIGFHPDAGASFYLSHLPGYLGEYLAMTGEQLNGVEMAACGLATHYFPTERLDWIGERLGKLVTDDPSVIETSLEQYSETAFPDKSSVVRKFEAIDRCFSLETVEEIIDAVEKESHDKNRDWCKSALRKLREASPLALKVSLKSIRDGRYQSLDQCLAREYRMSLQGIAQRISSDFSEGVRARLIDKDYSPKWDPPTLADVSSDMVDFYASPLGEFEPDLKLATQSREPFV